MTESEWRLVNSLASQLQHFRDCDGQQLPDSGLDNLLNGTQKMLEFNRWRLNVSPAGPRYRITEEQLLSLQGTKDNPDRFHRLIDQIRSQREHIRLPSR